MSMLAKARGFQRGFPWFIFDVFTQYQEQGVDYIAAILTGYKDPPPKASRCRRPATTTNISPATRSRCRRRCSDGQVDYDDGSPQTVEQYAKDVAAFLMWAAEPHLDARKRIGFQVMIFLIVFAGLLYFTKKKVWSAVH